MDEHMKKYQVIIVGAGPAGLCTALSLHQNNIKDICIIEINNETFHKPCAGFLTSKSRDNLKALGIDVEKDLNYQRVNSFDLFNNNKYIINVSNQCKEDFIIMFNEKPNREVLDNHLRKKVKDLGVEIFYNTKITDVNISKKEVVTEGEIFKYNYLVFADGMNGYSRKFNKVKSKNISIEAVFELDQRVEQFVDGYLGVSKQGYAWVFCSGTYVSIGLTDFYKKEEDYINKLILFGREKGYSINKEDIKGAFFSDGLNKNIVFDDVYLIGDAAGMTNPLSAEGLYYASEMAILLAKSVKQNDPDIYLEEIKRHGKVINKYKRLRKPFFSKFGRFILFDIIAKRFPGFATEVFLKQIQKTYRKRHV